MTVQPIKSLPFLFLLLLAVVLASCSPKPSPVELVMAYEDAYNTYDLDRLLSLFAEDAAFEVVGQFVFKGKEDIRRVAEYDSVLNIHMSIIRFATKDNTVSCELVETNDWLKTSGIGEVRYTGKFVFEEGLIKLIQGIPAPETEQAFNQVLNHLMEWASKERPERFAQMMPEGKFVYNAENAEKSLALLREWQEATKSE